MRKAPAHPQAERNKPPVPDGVAAGRRSRAGWWGRTLQFAAAFAGLSATGVATAASPSVAESDNYRSAAAVPATWQTFATQLRDRFEQQLAGDDAKARHLQDAMANLSGNNSGNSAPSFVLRTWVASDGRVDRVEFDGIDDPNVADDLRALLIAGNVGAPPPDMLQPLHLRLSLRAKDPSPREQ